MSSCARDLSASRYPGDVREAFASWDAADEACAAAALCRGITFEPADGAYTLRSSAHLYRSPTGEASWVRRDALAPPADGGGP